MAKIFERRKFTGERIGGEIIRKQGIFCKHFFDKTSTLPRFYYNENQFAYGNKSVSETYQFRNKVRKLK
jgi:hypothetical protein